MRTHLGLLFLWKRALMRRRESWTREQLLSYQAQQLATLRAHAVAHSSFYRDFHKGLEDAPLSDLPVLTKQQLSAHFDDIVTDRRITKERLDEHVLRQRPGTRFRHRYWVCVTSGSSGQRAIIPYGFSEWASVLASHSRVNDWARVRWKSPRRLRIGIVGAQSRWHLSAAASHTMRSLWLRIRRWSPADPLQEIGGGLSAESPDVLVTLAGMASSLVSEARAGRLKIAPQAVISVAELLTPGARRLIRETWNVDPFDMYAATETAGIAAECSSHQGLHLFEDLIIPEVVDEQNRPVPPGTPGAKLLVTVLYSRTVPLIRYQLDDSVTLSTEPCVCGRPFHRLSRIEGRVAQTLRFERSDGTLAVLHPVRFATIFDTLDLKGWQVVKNGNRLKISVAAPVPEAVLERVSQRTAELLQELGIEGAVLEVEVVSEIPRHASGKAILVSDNSERQVAFA
jgi:phenylacetate-coenzyme A ligase PaaK-like adenylate-forming protein